MRAVNELAGLADTSHLLWVCLCPSTNHGIFLTGSHRLLKCVSSRLPGSHSRLDLTEKEVYKQAIQFLQLIREAAYKSSNKKTRKFCLQFTTVSLKPGK